MNKQPYRTVQSLLLLLTSLVLGIAFYLQYFQGLQPCPLCIMQRFCTFLLLLFCFWGLYVSTTKWRRNVGVFQLVFAIAGLFFAVRQLWLQSLPVGQAPACIPDLGVLLRYFPVRDLLHALFLGTRDCGEVTWKLLGLSMPAWAALYFLIMLVGTWLLIIKAQHKP